MSTDYLSEMSFLSNLYIDQTSAEMLEKDLANSLREIHAQIKVVKTLGAALKHHLDDKILEGARAGEQVLLIDRFLRTALVAREPMWGWGKRFLTVDS
ncbi:unnamed protein product [Haemonchus placei]|uniref:PhoU domain-containing protein n=1 Tax=Haemonchus placei TaxID=6290 RepID=A0A0N4WUW4_HAEPC|nr:unnamed protein product [Haemonchus placei]